VSQNQLTHLLIYILTQPHTFYPHPPDPRGYHPILPPSCPHSLVHSCTIIKCLQDISCCLNTTQGTQVYPGCHFRIRGSPFRSPRCHLPPRPQQLTVRGRPRLNYQDTSMSMDSTLHIRRQRHLHLPIV